MESKGIPPAFQVLTYNIHAGRNRLGDNTFERQIDSLCLLSPDLLALQEVDRNWPRSFGVNQAKDIANALNMESFFSPNLAGEWAVGTVVHQYGLSLCWKGNVEIVAGMALPGFPGREHRGLVYAELSTQHGRMVFANTHLSRSSSERMLQAVFLADWVSCCGKPVLLAGDFNMQNDSPEYHCITEVLTDLTAGLGLVTFPDNVPDRQRDYLFASETFRAINVATVDHDLSDHRPVVGELQVID